MFALAALSALAALQTPLSSDRSKRPQQKTQDFIGRVVPTKRNARDLNKADLIKMPPVAATGAEALALAAKVDEIIDFAPSLKEPRYVPPPFARAPMANAALSVLKRKVAEPFGPPFRTRTEIVPDGSGGELHLVWADNRATQDLPESAPVALILHTITGDAETMVPMMRAASKRGWRACVLLRRGHGGAPLSEASPSFNVLGDVGDTTIQVSAARAACPRASFVGMVGISAGSGLLVSYCGQTGAAAAVDAAVSLCPAYDVREAFSSLGADSPLVERAMLSELRRVFLRGNEDRLRAHDASALEACEAARSLDSFLEAHAPFALRRKGATADEYFAHSNPMRFIDGSRTPMLVLNANDDMVCRSENIRDDLVRSHPGYALVRTAKGSHIAFNEGFLGNRCFMSRITFDFLDAAVAQAAREADEGGGGLEASFEQLFAELDSDASGELDRAEMESAIEEVYGSLDPKVVDEMMAATDTDGDGQISLDEFKAIMREGPKNPMRAVMSDVRRRRRRGDQVCRERSSV